MCVCLYIRIYYTNAIYTVTYIIYISIYSLNNNIRY